MSKIALTSRPTTRITAFDTKYVPNPVNAEHGYEPGHVHALPLAEVLKREWPADAHFAAYEPVEIEPFGPIRLVTDDLGCDEIERVRMVALIGDVDGPEHQATPEWRAETVAKIKSSGLAYYETRGGYRTLAQVDAPFEIASSDDAATWKLAYLGWCEYLEHKHGLVLDRSCCDWTRLYRAPNVVRENHGRQKARVMGALPIVDPTPGGSWREPPANAIKARSETLISLDQLPPANAGVAAALGSWQAHDGRKWDLLGHLGGLMHQCEFTAAECEAEVRAWLPANDPQVDVAKGVKRAVAAFSKPRESVSGRRALAEVIGEEHAAIVEQACIAIKFPWGTKERAKARSAAKEAREAAHFHAAGQGDEPDALLKHGRMVDRSLPPPPLVYVIEGLDLAQGKVSAVQAFANVAKTPFALLMAICVASGVPFLGHEVKQRNALFLAFEGGILTEEREARLCAGLGLARKSVPLHFMHVDTAIGKELLEDLCAYVEKHSIGLVAIDTYGSALPGDIEHNSDKFSFWLKQLGKLSDITGALVVVLLHENKSESAKGMRKMSGHNSAPGAIQAAIGLERTSDDRTLIDVYCSREVRKAFAPFRVQFKDVPCADAPTGLSLVAEKRFMPSAEADGKDTRPQNLKSQQDAEQKTRVAGARIWKQISEGNQRHTLSELRTFGGEGLRPCERALARLIGAGVVDLSCGKYAMSPAGADATPAKVSAALAGLSRVLPERFTKASEG